MKKHIKILAAGTCLFVLMVFPSSGDSQGIPPPPPSHGHNGNQPAGAPIDGGLGILLTLGAAYGGKMIYTAWKKGKEKVKRER